MCIDTRLLMASLLSLVVVLGGMCLWQQYRMRKLKKCSAFCLTLKNVESETKKKGNETLFVSHSQNMQKKTEILSENLAILSEMPFSYCIKEKRNLYLQQAIGLHLIEN